MYIVGLVVTIAFALLVAAANVYDATHEHQDM